MWSSYSVCTRTSNDPIIVAFEYGSLAFVYGLLRTCAFKYESLVFVYGLQVEVVLRKSYSVAQDTILIQSMNLSTSTYGKIMLQLCEAMEHMHSKHLLHRDIKSDNILLTEVNHRYLPMLTDFGKAIPLSDASSKQKCLSPTEPEEYRKKHQQITPEF